MEPSAGHWKERLHFAPPKNVIGAECIDLWAMLYAAAEPCLKIKFGTNKELQGQRHIQADSARHLGGVSPLRKIVLYK